jgi:hypothetical protein
MIDEAFNQFPDELDQPMRDFCINTGCTLKVSHIYPPIPCRQHDWCVYVDGDEERSLYGYGATREAAIRDFLENYADEYEAA